MNVDLDLGSPAFYTEFGFSFSPPQSLSLVSSCLVAFLYVSGKSLGPLVMVVSLPSFEKKKCVLAHCAAANETVALGSQYSLLSEKKEERVRVSE